MTPEQTIKRIAELADLVGSLANVGGMELAGQFVSVLARHPEHIETFLREGAMSDDPLIWSAGNGCLTFMNREGKVITPSQCHDAAVIRDITRPKR